MICNKGGRRKKTEVKVVSRCAHTHTHTDKKDLRGRKSSLSDSNWAMHTYSRRRMENMKGGGIFELEAKASLAL
jgi:hypothetical protein